MEWIEDSELMNTIKNNKKKYGHLEYPTTNLVDLLKDCGYDGYFKKNWYLIVFDPKDIKHHENLLFWDNSNIYE